MSVNKVILVGRLGRDPESRFTSGGQQVCNFTLATDESFKDRAGERQKRTEWHKIVAWGKLAEICQQYLTKGTLVYVEGKLQTREWEDREGNKRSTVEVNAGVMRILAGGKSDRAKWECQVPESPEDAREEEPAAAPAISDEDIPF